MARTAVGRAATSGRWKHDGLARSKCGARRGARVSRAVVGRHGCAPRDSRPGFRGFRQSAFIFRDFAPIVKCMLARLRMHGGPQPARRRQERLQQGGRGPVLCTCRCLCRRVRVPRPGCERASSPPAVGCACRAHPTSRPPRDARAAPSGALFERASVPIAAAPLRLQQARAGATAAPSLRSDPGIAVSAAV